MRPRYMETVEESLNDTAHILSAIVEEQLIQNPQAYSKFKVTLHSIFFPVFKNTQKRSFNAKIYSLIKTNTDIQVYITDEKGIVILDSEVYREGLDYSKFNDVYLTLQGKYGARSSKLLDKEGEGALFVASPIRYKNKIVGVLTVIKPKTGVIPFIEEAKRKFWRISLLVASSIALLFSLLAYLFFRPILRLSQYVSSLRKKENVIFPKIGIRELNELGKEVDLLVQEIEGKKYIESYVQTLTHEIKSPLSSILASVELLQSHPNESLRLTKNIHEEAKRIQNLIEQMLELSSLEGKKHISLDDRVLLYDLVQEVLSNFKSEIEWKSLQVLVLCENRKWEVKGNRNYLYLSIENIIRNSIDFANKQDVINIEIKEELEGFLRFSVLDEGNKIPDYALDRVTEKFYSLPRPTNNRKSSGLGLSIVNQIVDLHGGKLEIQNREPRGVSVSIWLPKS
ncbi:two-component system sensor histidine kinase CreC [Leptospira sp. 2 VSF19]|uniref:histidine kinase n=1 Tax=Leptospira soteropolitanensis TaxID=2950025 RepID=A0AAW5VCH8_9LEPT|nr:two-component system sensor histidine kinase CreC [Leptospira soteropolitanensis]MCW7491929.1 two-component system sensor histidine kinase CreC [Leptospira soteropolitanensis]MCW7499513.1 two-component system sensor histidine kinase CreC [Leptospira soteropolitanensis]MCW7520896.1 two-component system sensor histidine kinase CreC [Leptospira soteropolitanensis]MCW7525617.1 two-component system sensor histidine kinase CreC [Leptospira soteropolitanensis]MCW7529483.1 two-component system sens